MTPAPPVPFTHQIGRLAIPAKTILHRIHDGHYAADSFNPGLGRPSRFAPLRRPDGSVVATAYLASSFECAAFETVFHEIPPTAPFKHVDLCDIAGMNYSMLEVGRQLTLASLFEPELNRWSLSRSELIDTLANEYRATARWALAIHDAFADVDGLIWTSRRCDPVTAMVLFGDRVVPGDLTTQVSQEIVSSSVLLRSIRDFGRRAGITVTL